MEGGAAMECACASRSGRTLPALHKPGSCAPAASSPKLSQLPCTMSPAASQGSLGRMMGRVLARASWRPAAAPAPSALQGLCLPSPRGRCGMVC